MFTTSDRVRFRVSSRTRADFHGLHARIIEADASERGWYWVELIDLPPVGDRRAYRVDGKVLDLAPEPVTQDELAEVYRSLGVQVKPDPQWSQDQEDSLADCTSACLDGPCNCR